VRARAAACARVAALACAAAWPAPGSGPPAAALEIAAGLVPYRVYQRDASGAADVAFSGTAGAEGAVEARVTGEAGPLAGFDWREVGRAAGGRFEAEIPAVPTGGEYEVEARLRDARGEVVAQVAVPHVLVGDLWILAGQSNMRGGGLLIDVEAPVPRVHVFTLAHRWEVAAEPLHWPVDSPDPVHAGEVAAMDPAARSRARADARKTRLKGAGLGLPFAKEILRRTGVPVGLVAAAHGGASMLQWDPAGRDRGGETLYGSLYRQVLDAGGRVAGVLWYQGESDANAEGVPRFAERLRGLIAALRRDLASPELPFLMVQIGRYVASQPSAPWNAIQELQRRAAAEIPGTGLAASVDLPLDDPIHVGTSGLKRLGVRLAKLAQREAYGARTLETGPRLESVRASDGGWTIRVSWSGVNGRLLPQERVMGFSLHAANGRQLPILYKASVDPASPSTVLLRLAEPAPTDAVLWYGHGLDPFVNLTDEQDMAAPVFGPAKIER
jgi:sialate O-acetylesterase